MAGQTITKLYEHLDQTDHGPVRVWLELVHDGGSEPTRYKLCGEMMIGGLVLAQESVGLEPNEIARAGRKTLRHAQEIMDGKGL